VIPRFLRAHPPEIRRLLFATDAIESLHMQLRNILKTRGHVPNADAATRLLYLALRNIVRRCKAAHRDWKAPMKQFAILYPDSFTVAG
jgi:transposase-like protein